MNRTRACRLSAVLAVAAAGIVGGATAAHGDVYPANVSATVDFGQVTARWRAPPPVGRFVSASYVLQAQPRHNPGAAWIEIGRVGYSYSHIDSVLSAKLPPTTAWVVRVCERVLAGTSRCTNALTPKSALGGKVAASKDRGAVAVFGKPAPASRAPPVDAAQLDDLAARGGPIAAADPLSAALRAQQSEGAGQRGFDIGMAAAEGHTAPGPGKQHIRDSLSVDEQPAFEAAVAFSIERNQNAALAASGAAIAAADPTVAEARGADPDVYYQLGFDVATGMFGDPALGGQGHTATGKGSTEIRDSLSAAGQRGFEDSVKFHLAHNYTP